MTDKRPMTPYPEHRLRVSSLADIEAFERTPLDVRGLPESTYEMLRRGHDLDPSAPAIHYVASGDDYKHAITVTHGELFERITQAANLLHQTGIGPTDVVALLMPNALETQYALWGAEAAGIVCPINWMLEPEIIVKLLNAAQVKALIAYGPHPDYDIWNKVESIRRQVPTLKSIIKAGGGAIDDTSVLDLMDSLNAQPGDRLVSGRVIKSCDIAALFHTGGTTGAPKLAQHTHGNEAFVAWAAGSIGDLNRNDVRVCGVPLFHVTGVFSNSLAPLAFGGSIVMLTAGGWRHPTVLRNLWEIIAHFRITGMTIVPTVVNLLLQIPVRNADISSLTYCGCGTAPLSVHVARAFEEKIGLQIHEGFGMTEGTAVSASNPRYGEKKIGSIGLRIPYQQMKIIALDGKRDCTPNEPGLIALKGPNIFRGYLDPLHNEKAWLQDGWLNSGDLGYVDDDGYFWITGRAKDLIIRGGNNIDPRMVEEYLYAHPDVLDAAVVGRPDAHAGELPVAYIALKPNATTNRKRLKFYAYETVPERLAVPKEIYLVDVLPRTAVGKVNKVALRVDAIRRAQLLAIAAIDEPVQVDIDVRDRGEAGAFSTITLYGVAADSAQRVEGKVRELLRAFTVKYALRHAAMTALPGSNPKEYVK